MADLDLQDAISGDELLCDTYTIQENGPFFEVDGKMITSGATIANIGTDEDDEDDENIDDSTKQVLDVLYSFGFVQTILDKRTYLSHIKSYMKRVEQHLKTSNPERVEGFKTEAKEHVKSIVANFKDYEFYTGATMNPDGQVVLLNYREDGTT